jgi:hypothetical protein
MCAYFVFVSPSHASIDPKVRAERNLPEHLIRLCVGIEDPDDLLDDLEAALIQAGAIRIVDDPEERGEQRLERVGGMQRHHQLGQNIEQSIQALSMVDQAEGQKEGTGKTDFVTSAPGKVILFGEHAVVHGVVRSQVPPVQSHS